MGGANSKIRFPRCASSNSVSLNRRCTTKSQYERRSEILDVFQDLIGAARADYLLVSFNTEGYLTVDEIKRTLSARGYVASRSVDYKRCVGAQIGIYNPRGEKVGAISDTRNREYLFLVGPSRRAVDETLTQVASLN